MRLLYKNALNKVSKKNCGLIIDYLKRRVATGFKPDTEDVRRQIILTDVVYGFITTSRPVEEWLQNIGQNIQKMTPKKAPTELWMVIGGYGAGKSHMKEYVLEEAKKTQKVESIALEIATLLNTYLSPTSKVDNIHSLILLQTTDYFVSLHNKILNEEKPIDLITEYISDKDFIDAFCKEWVGQNEFQSFSEVIQDLLISKGGQLFLPLMKLYKKHLNIDGFCISVDEFEDLKLLNSDTRRQRFFESIRALYDTLVSADSTQDIPSFKLVILCTLSYLEELRNDTNSQALYTRIPLFEIPQLVEDEIIALAEKLYVLYYKSGYLKHQFRLDFTKTPNYLGKIAGIENPLTPRYVIKELINIIEQPADYIVFLSQQKSQ